MNPLKLSNFCQTRRQFVLGLLLCFYVLWFPSAGYGQTDPVRRLIGRLNDPDVGARARAATALGKMKDPRAVNPLIAVFDYEMDSGVRENAALALGNIRDPRAVGPLIFVLRNDMDDVRRGAAWALGNIGDPRAVEPLIIALNDPYLWARRAAAEALGQIGAPAVDSLIVALKNKSNNVCILAAYALGKIQDHRADVVLLAAGQDRNIEVIGGAYAFFISRGDPAFEGTLISALNQFGSREMAQDFLNCGNRRLAQAAHTWEANHDSLSMTTSSDESVQWGSARQTLPTSPQK